LPDVTYSGIDPTVEFRIPIVKQVAIFLGGGTVLLFGAGAIQTPQEYGQAKITAGQGMGGVDIALTSRLALRLVVEYAQYGYAFTGNGQQSNARDMDPATKDVGGALDRYIGGAATLAVAY